MTRVEATPDSGYHMHQALQLPELVDQILGHLEKYDQKRCVLVCQLWSEIALDHVWRTVESNGEILLMARIIAPLKDNVHTCVCVSPDLFVCLLNDLPTT
jgi:hypothetical protein